MDLIFSTSENFSDLSTFVLVGVVDNADNKNSLLKFIADPQKDKLCYLEINDEPVKFCTNLINTIEGTLYEDVEGYQISKVIFFSDKVLHKDSVLSVINDGYKDVIIFIVMSKLK